MLKGDLVLQNSNQEDHFLKENIKKVSGLIKDQLSGKVMVEFVTLGQKTYSYLISNTNETSKQKAQQSVL